MFQTKYTPLRTLAIDSLPAMRIRDPKLDPTKRIEMLKIAISRLAASTARHAEKETRTLPNVCVHEGVGEVVGIGAARLRRAPVV